MGNHSYNPFAGSLLDEQTYELHIGQINKQLAKTTRNKAALKSLMIETAANRRKWIVEDYPSIKEVLNKFPLLQEFDMVSYCCSIYNISYSINFLLQLLLDFSSATSIKDPISNAVAN